MLTPVDIASMAASGLLASVRLLKASTPLWTYIPPKFRWVATVLPTAVMVLPELAAKLLGVQTGMDLTEVLIVGVTLFLPGAKSGAHRKLEENHEELQQKYEDAQLVLNALKVEEK